MKNKSAVIFVLVVVAALGIIVYSSKRGTPQSADASLDGFATCLADKGATMYGAAWCPHCQREKAAFGASWRLVPYVECPENTQLCIDKGVNGYPTWIFDDGRRFEGEQGIEGLARASGCFLPRKDGAASSEATSSQL